MQQNETTNTKQSQVATYHVKVDPAGRVVMPAEIRARYNIHSGDRLVIRSGENGMEIRTYDQLMRDAQNLVCSLVPPARILSDELIAERRREAAAE